MSQFDEQIKAVHLHVQTLVLDLSSLQRQAETRAETRRVLALCSTTRLDLEILMDRCDTALQTLKD